MAKGGAEMTRWRCLKHRASWALFLFFSVLLQGCSRVEEEASLELAALRAEYEASREVLAKKRVAFAPRYQALVKEHWGTEAALQASMWLMEKAGRETRGEERTRTVGEFTDSILAEYAGSPGLWRLATYESLFSEEQLQRYFGELRETSPHPEVRAAAIFYPARAELQRLRPIRNLPRMPAFNFRSNGEDHTELLEAVEALEADLRFVMEEYPDVAVENSTFGVMADALLNPYTADDLAVGKPAPEIVGTDVDGREMRLSDFRGKVTVIDFWGDW